MKRGGVYFVCGVLAVVMLTLSTPTLSAQTSSTSVIAHGISASSGISAPDGCTFIGWGVGPASNTSYVLDYVVFNFCTGSFQSGFGTIPSSSFTLSGGSLANGKVTATLNVNTCDVPHFVNGAGDCGTFDVTWVGMPASAGTSSVNGTSQFSFPGFEQRTSGQTETFGATTTGTVLDYPIPTPTIGNFTEETNVTVTITTTKP